MKNKIVVSIVVLIGVIGLLMASSLYSFVDNLPQHEKDKMQRYFDMHYRNIMVVGTITAINPYKIRINEIFKNESELILLNQELSLSTCFTSPNFFLNEKIGSKFLIVGGAHANKVTACGEAIKLIDDKQSVNFDIQKWKLTFLRRLKKEHEKKLKNRTSDYIINDLEDWEKKYLIDMYNWPVVLMGKLLQIRSYNNSKYKYKDEDPLEYIINIEEVFKNNFYINKPPKQISFLSTSHGRKKFNYPKKENINDVFLIWAEKEKRAIDKDIINVKKIVRNVTLESIKQIKADIVFLGKIGKHLPTTIDEDGNDLLYFDVLKVEKNNIGKLAKQIVVKYSTKNKYGTDEYKFPIAEIDDRYKLYWLAANKIPNTDYYDAELIGMDASREIAFIKELQKEDIKQVK